MELMLPLALLVNNSATTDLQCIKDVVKPQDAICFVNMIDSIYWPDADAAASVFVMDANADNGCGKADVYIVNFTNPELLRRITKWERFNARAKFVFVGNTTEMFNDLEASLLVKFYITKAIAVIDKEIYRVPSSELIKTCTYPPLPSTWPNTTVKALVKCIQPYVECGGKNISGLDVFILDLLQNILKFDIEFEYNYSRGFGLKDENGSYTDAFGVLDQRQVDMTVGSFRTIGRTQYIDFEFTTNHMEDRLVWVVPKALPLEPWKRILMIFSLAVWLSLLASVAVVAKALHIVQKSSFFSSLFVSSSVLIGGPTDVLLAKSLPVKIILTVWIFCSMIITGNFTSKLIHVFFGDIAAFQIDSFRDILESSLQIGLVDDVSEMFAGELPEGKAVLCPFGVYCLNRTTYGRDLASCYGKRNIMYRTARSYVENGRPIVHLIEDHLLSYHQVFYFNRGFPMVPRMNGLILKFKAAGLVEHAYKMQKHRDDLISFVEGGRSFRSNVLNYVQLKGPFLVLYVGWTCGIASFCLELAKATFYDSFLVYY